MNNTERMFGFEVLAVNKIGEAVIEIDEFGTIRYFNMKGKCHREDGPAVEYTDGHKEWYKNGKSHREDGPAVECVNGPKYWFKNGLLHRENGPAAEYADGEKWWIKNGLLHREDGPAVELADGDKEYFYNDKKYMGIKTNEEWISMVKKLKEEDNK